MADYKLKKAEVIAILQEEIETTLTNISTESDDEGLTYLKSTKKVSAEILEAVANTYKRILTVEQADVAFGDLGTFRANIKKAGTFRVPSPDKDAEAVFVDKPARLSAKFDVSTNLKKQLEETEINK